MTGKALGKLCLGSSRSSRLRGDRGGRLDHLDDLDYLLILYPSSSSSNTHTAMRAGSIGASGSIAVHRALEPVRRSDFTAAMALARLIQSARFAGRRSTHPRYAMSAPRSSGG